MSDSDSSANLRSDAWFGDPGKNGIIARSHLRPLGLREVGGRPVIGICNTASQLNPCNSHLGTLATAVRRGIERGGGVALEFPVMSLGEPYLRPTSMLYRNLAAMELEETLRANPVDGVIALTGCDKTTPAALMAVASVDLPAMVFTGGPMLTGRFDGETVGSGTSVWRMSDAYRTGQIDRETLTRFEGCLTRSPGHCMTMGTASTMASMSATLGMQDPEAVALSAVDARRAILAEAAGLRLVEMVSADLRPSAVMTEDAFHNAAVVNAAIGGSTNAILHLLAIAGRTGVDLTLDDLDRIGADVPLLVDLMPSGVHVMEDLADAGGLPVVLRELRPLLREAPTTVGPSLNTLVEGAVNHRPDVVHPLSEPAQAAGSSTAVLRGSLAPDGAVLKVSAASPALLQTRGRALVFDRIEDYLAVVEDPDLEVTPTTVIVVRNLGPRGYPGMPELGNLPLPARLLNDGIDDVIRITDARMSGTAFGTCILHVAPEAAAGGPLAHVRTGDEVQVDVAGRRLDLLVDDDELARRAAAWTPPEPPVGSDRGWTKLYVNTVLQADRGVDLDFLVGGSGSAVPKAAF
jgi:dihydroxy-acid dehydratase